MIIGLICSVSAKEGSVDTLSKIENSVLGVEYNNQKTEQRLSRLEEYIYGHTKQGTLAQRTESLSKDLNIDLISEGNSNSEDDFSDEMTDGSVDYPILNDVEKKLSIKSAPNSSLHSRLVCIEKKLFNDVYDTDDFYTRVERIKKKMYGNSDIIANNEESVLEEYRQKNYYTQSPQRSGSDYKITVLEEKILKNTYPDENNNDRLARLENCVFDTEFYYDNEADRLSRLESAIRAKRSSNRYDNNKFQQRLNTALQIGTMILMVLACIL
jgi:hypothetical protein